MLSSNNIIVYTDGGCHGNPGPGAWSCVILTATRSMAIADSCIMTTNNRMEICAAIAALDAIIKTPAWSKKHITLYSDSQYLINGITKWIIKWKSRGWLRNVKKEKEVKNIDLWQELDLLNQHLDVEWKWVKGHNGNKYNDFCDKMCQDKISEIE